MRTQTLIVVQAFRRNEDGDAVPAMEPREMPEQRRAIARAKELSLQFDGAIAFEREVNPEEGEFSEAVVLFSRGALPDLDMPVRQDELDHDDGSADEPPETGDGGGDEGDVPAWMAIKLDVVADFDAFHAAFSKLYRAQPDRELLAVFTTADDRRMVVLPPEAATLVARALPQYRLYDCARPPGDRMSLEVGHTLQCDTTWFEISAEEREARKAAVRMSPEEIEAEDAYLQEFWGFPAPSGTDTDEVSTSSAADPSTAAPTPWKRAPRRRRPKAAKPS